VRTLLLLAAVALFKVTHYLPDSFVNKVPLHGLGAAMIVVFAMTTVHFKRLLYTAPLQWLGKVSYSLYLVHGIVLYSAVSLFWVHTRHHVLLLAGAMALALAVSEPLYRWVERPAVLLGRRLTRDRG
jgi:peptidoglycan/LPS O-acetylase OafA/YrhL